MGKYFISILPVHAGIRQWFLAALSVLCMFFAAGGSKAATASRTDQLLTEVLAEFGGELPPKVHGLIFYSDPFKRLVQALPQLKNELPAYIEKEHDSERLHLIGKAMQHLPFEEFIASQEMLVGKWRDGKIVDDQFRVIFVTPLISSRRLLFLYKNPRAAALMQQLRIENQKRINKVMHEETFSLFESGYLRRYDLIRWKFHYLIDDEKTQNLDATDKFLEDVYRVMHIPLLSAAFLLACVAVGVLIRAKRKMYALLPVVMATACMLFSWAFYRNWIIL